MFLDNLRQSKLITCTHPDDSFHVQFKKDGDRLLTCNECELSLSLRDYFFRHLSPEEAICQAKHYVDWNGDYNVPCCLRTLILHTRTPASFVHTTYDAIFKGSILLKMLHSPFTRAAECEEPTPEGKQFLRKTIGMGLDQLIRQFPDDDSLTSVDVVVRSALVFLKNICHVELKRYFEVLVPYVKSTLGRQTNRSLVLHSNNCLPNESLSLGKAIHHQLIQSYSLHGRSSGLCASFDAVQVAALCFLCREDVEMASSLVLDFVGKMCRGHYDGGYAFQPTLDPLEWQIRELLASHVSMRSNVRMNRYLDVLRAGGSELKENLSSEFFFTYWDLKSAIQEKHGPAHFEWIFPRMLFANYVDYCAFLAALTYYAMETEMTSKSIDEICCEKVSPRVLPECKNIFWFVRSSLSKLKAFDQCFVESELQKHKHYNELIDSITFSKHDAEIRNPYYWTRDMLKRFFEMDPNFESDLVNAMKWWAKLPLHHTNDPELSRKPIEIKFSKDTQVASDAKEEPSPDTLQTTMTQSDLYHNLWNGFMKKNMVN